MAKVKIKSAPKARKGATLEPLTGDMMLFKGPSHEKGGIPYKGVEVEGGEPLYQSETGQEVIFGNMLVPGTKKKFKDLAKELAKKEQKVDKLIATSSSLVNGSDPEHTWDSLRFNSGKAMLTGAMHKKKELKTHKEHLKSLQEAMLETAAEMGADPHMLSKGRLMADKGLTLFGDDPNDLSPKYQKFLELLHKKGIEYKITSTKREKKKGDPFSHHHDGNALDLQPGSGKSKKDFKAFYNAIKKDPELVQYMHENKIGFLNEATVMGGMKTKEWTGDHFHFGDDPNLYKNTVKNFGPAPKGTVQTAAATSTKEEEEDEAIYSPTYTNMEDPKLQAYEKDRSVKREPTRVGEVDYDLEFTQAGNPRIASNAQGLDWKQIMPEIYAFGQNQVEPVAMQQFSPELYQPTSVSFQDRLNQNNASFSSLQRLMSEDPEALGALASQKYAADNQVMGEEFRTNQQIQQDVVNKNISLLNEAELKNLQLADTQFTRQSQAKSNTKTLNKAIMDSISGKIAQTEARNQGLKYFESLTGYRFNPESGTIEWAGGKGAAEDLSVDSGITPVKPATSTQTVKDGDGNVKYVKEKDPGILQTQLMQQELWNKHWKVPSVYDGLNKKKNPVSFWNTSKK